MKIPGADFAVVPEAKLTQYLLNPAHPVGRSKALFFLKFGFTAISWRDLAEALLKHARENDATLSGQTTYGVRYFVDGILRAPDGTMLNIRSAWYIDTGSKVPRFVTAHPLPKL
jgi:hypothetical protein